MSSAQLEAAVEKTYVELFDQIERTARSVMLVPHERGVLGVWNIPDLGDDFTYVVYHIWEIGGEVAVQTWDAEPGNFAWLASTPEWSRNINAYRHELHLGVYYGEELVLVAAVTFTDRLAGHTLRITDIEERFVRDCRLDRT
jgi:hypothetical protein